MLGSGTHIGVGLSRKAGRTEVQSILDAIRRAAATAQGLPEVLPLAERPVITSYPDPDTALTVAYDLHTWADTLGVVRSSGGAFKDYGGNRAYKAATVLSGANIGGSDFQSVVTHDVATAAPVVEFYLWRQGTTHVRLLARSGNGHWRYLAAAPTPMSLLDSSACVRIAFDAPDPDRVVRLEVARHDADSGTAALLIGLRLPAGYSAIAPAAEPKPRAMVLGDSFVEGGGATFRGDGFAPRLAWLLGCTITNSGVGGIGYLADTGGSQLSAGDDERLDDLLLEPYDFAVIALGTNDVGLSGLQAAVEATLTAARQRLPGKPLLVVTPWNLLAPAPLAAGHAAVRDAIVAACAGHTGVYAMDPEGLAFSQADIHPDAAGHATIAQWLADAILDVARRNA